MIFARFILLPPRLIFPADLRMHLPQHRYAPPAPRPRRQTFRNLRRRLRFLTSAKALDLAERDMEAKADRIVRVERHEGILAIN